MCIRDRLKEVNIGTEDAPIIVPTAFYAVVSVAVIGLYLAFLIPIYLRWRAGDKFKQGPWNLGTKWKWMAPIACLAVSYTHLDVYKRQVG